MDIVKRHLNKTKLVATIGPSTWDPAVMKEIIAQGVTVARLNGAFADRKEMLKVEKLVRDVSDKVGLMIDIKGPEVRLNKFSEAMPIKQGDVLDFGNSDVSYLYPANYPDTYKKLDVGQKILVGDGDVELEVTEIGEAGFTAKVKEGRLLKPGKALNFPGLTLQENPITDKDQDLLDFAEERGWDFVSASFIRTPEDAKAVRKAMKPDSKISIVAKIEDETGVENIEEILPEIDSVMIARGGLGVDMGLARIPWAETTILRACNSYGKPVIMATQLLDSMERNPQPTRAEASDVGNAILNGADALMTSGETTAGRYPVEAITLMTEVDGNIDSLIEEDLDVSKLSVEDANLTQLAAKISEHRDELAGVIFLGNTRTETRILELLAQTNLKLPLFAMGADLGELRQLQLVKGVTEIFTLGSGKSEVTESKELTEFIDSFSLSGKYLVCDNREDNFEFSEIEFELQNSL